MKSVNGTRRSVPDRVGRRVSGMVKTGILFLTLPAFSFGQGQQLKTQDQLAIQQPAQLVGKKINVGRLPLCEPRTYTVDFQHAGMEATVLSANASSTRVLPKSVLDKVSPAMRDIMLDQQKAALLLLQFGDGAKRDTCAAIGPKKLAEYIELAPGETLDQVAAGLTPANLDPKPASQPIGELSHEEVKALSPGQTLDQVTPHLNSANLAAPQATTQPIGEFSREEVKARDPKSAGGKWVIVPNRDAITDVVSDQFNLMADNTIDDGTISSRPVIAIVCRAGHLENADFQTGVVLGTPRFEGRGLLNFSKPIQDLRVRLDNKIRFFSWVQLADSESMEIGFFPFRLSDLDKILKARDVRIEFGDFEGNSEVAVFSPSGSDKNIFNDSCGHLF